MRGLPPIAAGTGCTAIIAPKGPRRTIGAVPVMDRWGPHSRRCRVPASGLGTVTAARGRSARLGSQRSLSRSAIAPTTDGRSQRWSDEGVTEAEVICYRDHGLLIHRFAGLDRMFTQNSGTEAIHRNRPGVTVSGE